MDFTTKLLHGKSVRKYAHGSTLPEVCQVNAFSHGSAEEIERVFAHKAMGYAYSRIGNPTVSAFEKRVMELEGGSEATATASGMAAVTISLLNILESGDEIIASGELYGGTFDLFEDLGKFGIAVRYVSRPEPEKIEALINEHTRAVFIETISNPGLYVADIRVVANVAHSCNIPLIVDNTTATPYIVNPIKLGADIVVHSSSKYINGGGNSISGIIIDGGVFKWDFEKFGALRKYKKYGPLAYSVRMRTGLWENIGACLSPVNAYLNIIGLETLGLRMERITQNAFILAKELREMDVTAVRYPLLEDSESFETADAQLSGKGGGIITMRAGSKKRAFAILNALQYAAIASNIGDIRTLVLHPASTIFSKCTEERKRAAGVFDDTIRISVGIEDPKDLTEDFRQAIERAEMHDRDRNVDLH